MRDKKKKKSRTEKQNENNKGGKKINTSKLKTGVLGH